jgi:excisionase family DNA binding protein
VSELARVLLDEIAADPAALDRLRALLGVQAIIEPEPTDAAEVELLSVAKVAKIIGRSTRTVHRRIETGELRAFKDHGQWLVRADDLRAYIEQLEQREQTSPRPRRAQRRRAQADEWQCLLDP